MARARHERADDRHARLVNAYGPVIVGVVLGSLLAVFGWMLRQHFRHDDARDSIVDGLREDVAFVRGVLAMAFPAAASRVEKEQGSNKP